MEGMELASFQIIGAVGGARSKITEALQLARQRKFTEAYRKIDEANHYLSEGHKNHVNLIQKEANGEKIPMSMLFIHAEDQFMTTYLLRDIAYEMVELWKATK
ncbi:PTS lactose/cellobiose transporter subunit IIA [Listeria newyorkensis]|uniref:PTS lactose/cellobiose transporter subunit IIA n=1 Tax=Listeria newyorkensis TaxID=1497681 RepID=A0ABX4XP27_9LIST|nr:MULTISPECIES: PTS lactose/cellobiose transporter subunit IIA [Listeria]KGL41355.1 PTS dihydroxyacetone transporter [Listeriaceae bacterium FSL A5-0209]KGL44691.1 PTS dihydroxyacetone transporter [Listeria newyorkensis]KMT62382.1 PTS system beta-glucoside-specific transporter subunit IIA [Listeria newyorkensis]PNP93795.1 PTS lactose/cellobiose transporter subunit IIA [Listeria newyorkensis]RQW67296.1 PTS lactose/cellobiose transporter subunit IIA [Listeria sp. SHR_NRA_18]